MSWHIPENELAGTPYAIAVTDPGASSGARTVAVTGWPSGWTSFPKIVVAIRSGQIVAAYEATAYSGGNLSLSGVIDGYTDAALLTGDTIELRPTKLAITEIQSAVTTNTSSISTINTTLGTLGSAAFVATSTFDAAGAAAAAQSAAESASQPLSSTLTSLASASYSTGHLLGGQGTGVPSVVTVGSGLSLSGGTLTSTAGGGSVTSVGLSLPSFIAVTGSPITGSGTLTGTLATQSANVVFAGPSSGSAAAPTFRALTSQDIPSPLQIAQLSGPGVSTAYISFASGLGVQIYPLASGPTLGVFRLPSQATAAYAVLSTDSIAAAQNVGFFDAVFTTNTHASFQGSALVDANSYAGRESGIRVDSNGSGTIANVAFFVGSGPSYQSGVGVAYLANATTTPTGAPSGGGFLYASGGALYWLGSSGTSTKIANA